MKTTRIGIDEKDIILGATRALGRQSLMCVLCSAVSLVVSFQFDSIRFNSIRFDSIRFNHLMRQQYSRKEPETIICIHYIIQFFVLSNNECQQIRIRMLATIVDFDVTSI